MLSGLLFDQDTKVSGKHQETLLSRDVLDQLYYWTTQFVWVFVPSLEMLLPLKDLHHAQYYVHGVRVGFLIFTMQSRECKLQEMPESARKGRII